FIPVRLSARITPGCPEVDYCEFFRDFVKGARLPAPVFECQVGEDQAQSVCLRAFSQRYGVVHNGYVEMCDSRKVSLNFMRRKQSKVRSVEIGQASQHHRRITARIQSMSYVPLKFFHLAQQPGDYFLPMSLRFIIISLNKSVFVLGNFMQWSGVVPIDQKRPIYTPSINTKRVVQ